MFDVRCSEFKSAQQTQAVIRAAIDIALQTDIDRSAEGESGVQAQADSLFLGAVKAPLFTFGCIKDDPGTGGDVLRADGAVVPAEIFLMSGHAQHAF